MGKFTTTKLSVGPEYTHQKLPITTSWIRLQLNWSSEPAYGVATVLTVPGLGTWFLGLYQPDQHTIWPFGPVLTIPYKGNIPMLITFVDGTKHWLGRIYLKCLYVRIRVGYKPLHRRGETIIIIKPLNMFT